MVKNKRKHRANLEQRSVPSVPFVGFNQASTKKSSNKFTDTRIVTGNNTCYQKGWQTNTVEGTEACTDGVKKLTKNLKVIEIVKDAEPPYHEEVQQPEEKKRKVNAAVQGAKAEFNVDKYRSSHESEEHWELRRMFIEKNYQTVPEDELECLTHIFTNIEFLRCLYPPELMARIAEMSEGIVNEYRNKRRAKPQRTFVPASTAAALKVQRKELDLKSLSSDGVKKRPAFYERIRFPKTLEEVLQNIIVVNNSFQATEHAFNNLKCGIRLHTTVSHTGTKNQASLYAGNFMLVQVTGTEGDKALKKKLETTALNYFAKRCYSLLRKKQITQMHDVSVIAKPSLSESQTGKPNASNDQLAELIKMDSSNVGFKLMQKLGWKGGCLGARGEGIVDPVEAKLKMGRSGLGHNNSNTLSSFNEVQEQLLALRKGIVQNHLVFSSDFTKEERAEIHKMAQSMQLKTRSFGSDKEGKRRLVVYVSEVSTHEKLQKVLIDKDPYYSELYEVREPSN